MSKIIFLDIDGVLNTEVYITAFWDICDKLNLSRDEAHKLHVDDFRDEYGAQFDPMAVRFLKYVCEKTDAKIVISSTWRQSGLEIMKKMWVDRKLPSEVIDITPDHSRRTGTTLQRGKEIAEWLSNHPEVESYVIFNDDTDMEQEQMINFVNTDQQYGITYNDAEKAIEILNRH